MLEALTGVLSMTKTHILFWNALIHAFNCPKLFSWSSNRLGEPVFTKREMLVDGMEPRTTSSWGNQPATWSVLRIYPRWHSITAKSFSWNDVDDDDDGDDVDDGDDAWIVAKSTFLRQALRRHEPASHSSRRSQSLSVAQLLKHWGILPPSKLLTCHSLIEEKTCYDIFLLNLISILFIPSVFEPSGGGSAWNYKTTGLKLFYSSFLPTLFRCYVISPKVN